VGSCPGVLHLSFSCFPGLSLALEPRGRLGGEAGSACEESEDSEGVYWVNVSESSGTSLPRLSWIKSC